ncbi:hypothetical protein [Nibrella viscosa]|uniref:hypothetical protein n=1 Tax=Nibrella viscosa TaxID=1084524 RepID=UPI0031EE6106
MKVKNETVRFCLMVLFALSLLAVQHLTFSHHIVPHRSVPPVMADFPGGSLFFSLVATCSLALLFVINVKGKGNSQ